MAMFSRFNEMARSLGQTYSIIVMDEEQVEPPRQYRLRPRSLLLVLTGAVLLLMLLAAGLVAFTPLRTLVPGYESSEMLRDVRLNTLRLVALQDSLEAQHQYVARLRQLMMGEVDTSFDADAASPEPAFAVTGSLAEVASEPRSKDWSDHEQPALSVERLPVLLDAPMQVAAAGARHARLQFPVLPPVSGFLTRGFDARTGHFAVDIAVEEGTVVRSIADGHVVLADWTQEGGYTMAVQHADGYLSLYKHNQRLLKRIGERVYDREAIAVSGNSGEVTTGPHLHFELWRHGLAQDPRSFFIGW